MKIIYIADEDCVLANDRFGVLKESVKTDYIKFFGFIKERNFILKLIKNIILFLKLLFIIKTKKIDVVVHLGVYHFILNFLSYFNVKVIAIPQGSEINQLYNGRVKKFVDVLLDNSTVIAARSNGMKQRLLKIKPDIENKIHLLNWGIKDIFFQHDYTPSDQEKINILSYRATGEIYNIDLIFDAIKAIKSKYKNINFIYVEYNKSIDLDLDLDLCDEYYKTLSQSEIATLLKRSDICISIPSYDGFATSLVEALAAGCYPIISDIDAYKDDFIDKNLLSKTSLDVEELTNVLVETIENTDILFNKKEYRTKFIEENYSRKSQINKLHSIINLCRMRNNNAVA